jgi:undecaprenyl-diphosphatase
VSNLDKRLVLTLYDWAAGNSVAHTLTLLAAQRLVFLIPLALIAAWWWPPAGQFDRRRVLLAVVVSAVLGGLATLALGVIVDRARPFVALGLTPLFPHGADSSFPSDHTMLGVALAAPLVWRLWRFGLPLLLVALLVGFARVAAAVHWPSDIIGSALLALLLGALAVVLTDLLLARVPRRWQERCGLAPSELATPPPAPQFGGE